MTDVTGAPQGGLSCPFGAIHLLAIPPSFSNISILKLRLFLVFLAFRNIVRGFKSLAQKRAPDLWLARKERSERDLI